MGLFSFRTFRKTVAFLCLVLIVFPSWSVSAQGLFQNVSFFSSEKIPEIPASTRTQLVSILVEESLLEDTELVEKIERYARDVQKAINGKTILIPIPKDFSPYEIFEGNSTLYFSGKEGDRLSQLVGTVLVGDVPLPVVDKNGSYHPTVFPYTDFERPNYSWDFEKERFVFVEGDEDPEIWHGIIRSDVQTGDTDLDRERRIAELKKFFDTNHQFHEGSLTFNKKVFHADLLTQKTGLPDFVKDSYHKWLDNIDHILYKHYSKKLAQDLFDDQGIDEVIPKDYLPSNAKPSADTDVSFDTLPDIYSKGVLDSIIRRYFENYEGYLSALYDDMDAAGRWKPEDIDTTITLISQKDEVSAKLLKEFNDEVEALLFEEVQNTGVANDIYIPTKKIYRKVVQKLLPVEYSTLQHEEKDLYWNGIERIDIDTADECSLRRGNLPSAEYPYSQLVELNNAYDLSTTNQCPDVDNESDPPSVFQINADTYEGCCAANLSYSGNGKFSNNACVSSSDWQPACETSIFGLGNDCFLKGTNIVKTMREGFVHRGAETPLFNWAGARKISSGAIGASACPEVVFSPASFTNLVVPKECTDAMISWMDGGAFAEVLSECVLISDMKAVLDEAQNLAEPAGDDLLAQGLVVDPYTTPSPCSDFSDPDTCSEIVNFSPIPSQAAEQDTFNTLLQEYLDKKGLGELAYNDVVQAHISAAETQIELDPNTSSLQLLNSFTDLTDLEILKNKKQDEEDDFETVYEDDGNAGSLRDAYQEASANGMSSLLPLIQTVLDGFSSWEAEKERQTETRLGDPFSSLMNHVEPTQEAIEAQLQKGSSSAPMDLPIDDPRGFSFYDHASSPKFHRIAYPNVFEFRDLFLGEPENLRKKLLLDYLDEALDQKVQEINATGGNTGKIPSTVFDSLWNTYSKAQIIDAVLWLDKSLEEKNQEMLIGALSAVSRGKTILHDSGFDGYEVVQIIGSASTAGADYGIEANFERGEQDPSSVFLEAERQQLSAEFQRSLSGEISGKNSESSSVFENESVSKAFSEAHQDGCNRKLLSWTGSCLIPWLGDLPKSFGKFLKIPTLFDSKTGSITSPGVASNAPLPEDVRIAFFPEKINLSSKDTLPQKVEIHLLDSAGNLLANDFSTEIEFHSAGSDFQRFFRSASPDIQTFQGGKISFFFTPKTSDFGGKFSLDFTVNNDQTFSLPVVVSTDRVVVDFPKRTFIAGDLAHPVQITVVDKNGKTNTTFDGNRFRFSSDIGTFSDLGQGTIQNGKVSTTFTPSRKSGKGTLRIENIEGRLPTEEIAVEVLPADPHKLVYKTQQNALVLGAEPSHIEAVVTDRYGNEIPDSEETISYETQDLEVEEKPEIPGIFVSLPQNQDDPAMRVASSLLEKKGEKRSFFIAESPRIVLGNSSEDRFVVGKNEAYSLPVKITDILPEKFLGKTKVFVHPSTSAVGIFPEFLFLENGEGVLEFFPGKISGDVSITLSAPGFQTVTAGITIHPEVAYALSVQPTEKTLDADSNTPSEVKVRVADRYGNTVEDFSEEVFVRMNPPEILDESEIQTLLEEGTIDEARAEHLRKTENPSVLSDFYPTSVVVDPPIEQQITEDETYYAANIDIRNGRGSFSITPAETPLRLHILAESEGLVPGVSTVDINNTLSLQDFSVLSPTSAFTVLGGFDGGTFERPNMGNRFLFSGKTQAVATLIEDDDRRKTHAILDPSGSSVSGEVSFASQNFFGFLLEADGTPALEAEIRFSKSPKVSFEKNPEKKELEKEGLHFFPEILSAENKLLYSNRKIWLNDLPLLHVLPSGGMISLDARVQVRPKGDSFLSWEVVFDGEKIIDLIVVPESQEFFEASFADTIFSGIFYAPVGESYEVRPFFTGKTTNDPKGVQVLSKVQAESEEKKLGFSTMSLEDMAEEKTIGWKGAWKPFTHIAAQTSVGEGVRFGASDNVVLLGDPTVTLREKNESISLQLTEDIGKILWKSSEGSIDEIAVGDLNNDGLSEVFPRIGDTLHALYHDEKRVDNFRHTGPILRFADGAKRVVAYTDPKNDLQYLIQLNDDGRLIFHENREGRLVRTEKNIFPEETRLLDIQVGKINNDPYKDLVVLDENNTIFFVHGNAQNEFYPPKELYNFSPRFVPIDEEHSRVLVQSAEADFQEKSQEFLSETYISLPSLSENIYEDQSREINGAAYTSFPNNSAIEGHLTVGEKGNPSVRVGDTISAEFELKKKSSVGETSLLIPKLFGTTFLADSFSCQGCLTPPEVTESETHIGIPNVRFPVNGKVIFSWDFQMDSIPPIQFLVEDFSGKDGVDDIAVPWEGEDEIRRFIKFVSDGSSRNYPKRKNVSASEKGVFAIFSDFLKAQAIDSSPGDSLFYETHQKITHEAFPESDTQSPLLSGAVDSEALANNVLGSISLETRSVADSIKNMGCGGGCGLPIPSYVFNAPGNQSLYIPPFGFPGLPSLPIPVIGLAALQIIPSIPFVLPFAPALPASFFRLFVMPTTTAQVGMGICVGPPSGFSIPPLPIGNCFVIVPPFLELLGACPASLLGLDNSPALQVLQGGFLSDSFQAGGFTPPTVSAPTNKKLMSADIITEWVKQQFEEFGNFKFPSINFRFPSFPSQEKNNSNKKFIQKLEDSPYINLEKKVFSIPYPEFSEAQLDTLDIGWASWKSEYKNWKCDAQNKTYNASTGKCEGTGLFSIAKQKTAMAVILTLLAKKEKNKFLNQVRSDLSAELELSNSCGLSPEKQKQFEQGVSKKIETFTAEIQKNASEIETLSADVGAIEKEELRTLGNQILADSRRESQEILSGDFSVKTSGKNTSTCSGLSADLSAGEEKVNEFSQEFSTLSKAFSSGSGGSSFVLDSEVGTFLDGLKGFLDTSLNIALVFEKFDTNLNNFEQNITTLKNYKQSAKTLKEFPAQLFDLLQKLELSTSFIEDYFSVWLRTNKTNAAEWKNFQFELQSVLGIWMSIPEIFKGLEPICTRCNVNRGSMLEWLLRMLLGGIKLPVIPMPKLPDIEVDMSRIGIGFSLPVPEIKLEPVPFDIPSLPNLPNVNVSRIFFVFLLRLVSEIINFDWDAQLSPSAQKISGNFLTLLFLGLALDIDDFNIDDVDLLGLVNRVFDEQFQAVIEQFFANIDLEKIPEISAVAVVPLLPQMPRLDQLGVSLDMPVLNLPVLPTILPPPIIPDFLGKLKTIINIPKPFFNLICFFFMGYLPVPEWKVASTVQERTNRTLLLPIDFSFSALTPKIPKKSPQKKTIAFEETYIDFLGEMNQKLADFETLSNCTVRQLANGERGGEIEDCILPEKTAVSDSISVVQSVDLFNEEEIFSQEKSLEDLSNNRFVQNQVAQLKNLIQDQNVLEKNDPKSQEKFFADLWGTPPEYDSKTLVRSKIQRWLSSTLDIDLSKIPTSVPETVDQQAQVDEANAQIPYVPRIYFYDPETDSSASVIEYPLEGVAFTSLAEDIDEDGEEEVLFSLNDELYLKRRYEVPKPVGAFEADSEVEWWKAEKFLRKYVPASFYEHEPESSGDTLSFEQTFGKIPYFEWTVSDRPDVVFEYHKDVSERFSDEWKRVGFLIRKNPRKYQIRPSSAQIQKIKGEPLLFGSSLKPVPLLKERDVCDDDSVSKPFYATETILVSEENNTIFNIRTKDRNGQTQGSYWKTMNKGEETLVDFAEVCLISGSLREVTTDERTEMQPSVGDYFSSGMLLDLGEGDEVHLELFDGRTIIVHEHETYQLHYFEEETPVVAEFLELEQGNHYGIFQGFIDDEYVSHTRAKLLHDPQPGDDTTFPTIVLRNGERIEAYLYEDIQIDASQSYDDTAITSVSWQTEKEGIDLSDEDDLQILLPAQDSVGEFFVTLEIQDASGNVSEAEIQIEVVAPQSEIIEAEYFDKRILGKAFSQEKNIPITVFRERNGKKVPFSSIVTNENGRFEMELVNNGGIEVWEKNPRKKVFEVLPTGRPVIFDDRFFYKIFPATETFPMQIVFFNNSQEKIARLAFGLKTPQEIDLFDSKKSLESKIRLSSSIENGWKWVRFETDVVSFKKAFALVNTDQNFVLGVINEYGAFSFSESAKGRLLLKETTDITDPVEIQVFLNDRLAGAFVLPLEENIWVK